MLDGGMIVVGHPTEACLGPFGGDRVAGSPSPAIVSRISPRHLPGLCQKAANRRLWHRLGVPPPAATEMGPLNGLWSDVNAFKEDASRIAQSSEKLLYIREIFLIEAVFRAAEEDGKADWVLKGYVEKSLRLSSLYKLFSPSEGPTVGYLRGTYVDLAETAPVEALSLLQALDRWQRHDKFVARVVLGDLGPAQEAWRLAKRLLDVLLPGKPSSEILEGVATADLLLAFRIVDFFDRRGKGNYPFHHERQAIEEELRRRFYAHVDACIEKRDFVLLGELLPEDQARECVRRHLPEIGDLTADAAALEMEPFRPLFRAKCEKIEAFDGRELEGLELARRSLDDLNPGETLKILQSLREEATALGLSPRPAEEVKRDAEALKEAVEGIRALEAEISAAAETADYGPLILRVDGFAPALEEGRAERIRERLRDRLREAARRQASAWISALRRGVMADVEAGALKAATERVGAARLPERLRGAGALFAEHDPFAITPLRRELEREIEEVWRQAVARARALEAAAEWTPLRDHCRLYGEVPEIARLGPGAAALADLEEKVGADLDDGLFRRAWERTGAFALPGKGGEIDPAAALESLRARIADACRTVAREHLESLRGQVEDALRGGDIDTTAGLLEAFTLPSEVAGMVPFLGETDPFGGEAALVEMRKRLEEERTRLRDAAERRRRSVVKRAEELRAEERLPDLLLHCEAHPEIPELEAFSTPLSRCSRVCLGCPAKIDGRRGRWFRKPALVIERRGDGVGLMETRIGGREATILVTNGFISRVPLRFSVEGSRGFVEAGRHPKPGKRPTSLHLEQEGRRLSLRQGARAELAAEGRLVFRDLFPLGYALREGRFLVLDFKPVADADIRRRFPGKGDPDRLWPDRERETRRVFILGE